MIQRVNYPLRPMWATMKWIGNVANNSPDLVFLFFASIVQLSFMPAHCLWAKTWAINGKTKAAIMQAYHKKSHVVNEVLPVLSETALVLHNNKIEESAISRFTFQLGPFTSMLSTKVGSLQQALFHLTRSSDFESMTEDSTIYLEKARDGLKRTVDTEEKQQLIKFDSRMRQVSYRRNRIAFYIKVSASRVRRRELYD